MRIKEFDVARGFTVLIMPGVHVILMYGNTITQAAWPGKLFGFLAEGPGAPLFMFLMGVSFGFSTRVSRKAVIKRSLQLAVLGYLLNFFKFTCLQAFHLLPQRFMDDYGINKGSDGVLTLLTTGDILQFAAIALLIIQLISTLPRPFLMALICVGCVIAISPLHTGMRAHYLTDLFTAEHGLIFFPVFPWLAYPLCGYCMIYLLRRGNAFTICRNTGVLLLAFSLFLSVYCHISITSDFYRSQPAATLYHIAVVLLWLYACHMAVRYAPATRVCTLLYWLSRNILPLYCIQWVLVCWLLPIAGYKASSISRTLIWIVFITSLTSCILLCFQYLKQYYHARNHRTR